MGWLALVLGHAGLLVLSQDVRAGGSRSPGTMKHLEDKDKGKKLLGPHSRESKRSRGPLRWGEGAGLLSLDILAEQSRAGVA